MMVRIAASLSTATRRGLGARAFSSKPATTAPRRSLRSAHTVHSSPSEPSLADKFSLAALNGGKNPFEVASQRLMHAPRSAPPTRGASTSAETAKDVFRRISAKSRDMRDVYSLDYLLGKQSPVASKPLAKKKKSPFDVASAKLM
ncbi:hypothetical protein P43SY_009936 [Pythium insidiosum]|uniref:Uncharacterized protein n=1 Tax=Pythium insidiosum TaxID=114742 RepID=A0AAD5LGB1_PYTIN|nr:hypothetical protein P43SY_009936 [Pythium insidiosum]